MSEGLRPVDRAAIEAYVRDNPIKWPPLTEEQRTALAMLLRPGVLAVHRKRQEALRAEQQQPKK